MEINKDEISIAHIGTKIIKVFDNPDECVKFCNDFKKQYAIDISADPLYMIQQISEREGYIKSDKDAWR
jgi:hypothetical protein